MHIRPSQTLDTVNDRQEKNMHRRIVKDAGELPAGPPARSRERMLAPLPPNRQRPIGAFGHRNRLHAARQFASLELEHMHPFAHDEVIVRVHGAVGLVLDERH